MSVIGDNLLGGGPPGPFLLTGEPKLEYLGRFSLLMPVIGWLSQAVRSSVSARSVIVPPLFISILGLPPVAGYVSQLADSWDPPGETLEVQPARTGPVDTPIPGGRQLPPLSVTYIDDSIGSVYALHAMWLRGIFAPGRPAGLWGGLASLAAPVLALGGINVNGTGAYPLGAVSLMAGIVNEANLPMPGGGYQRVATSQEIWPRVFPQAVTPSRFDRGGQNVQTVDVSYGRVPVFDSSAGLAASALGQAATKAEGMIRTFF